MYDSSSTLNLNLNSQEAEDLLAVLLNAGQLKACLSEIENEIPISEDVVSKIVY